MKYEFVAATENITIVQGDHVGFENAEGHMVFGQVINVHSATREEHEILDVLVGEYGEEEFEVVREDIDQVEVEMPRKRISS